MSPKDCGNFVPNGNFARYAGSKFPR
jgi:hypothetical protein